MLFKDIEGKEILDKNGQRIGYVQDFVFTTAGRITHIIGAPKGFLLKVTVGQLNIQFEDIAAIDKLVVLNKSKEQLLGKEEPRREPPKEEKKEERPRILLKKKK